MAIKKFYQSTYIAGLRSNPKLCIVQRDGNYLDVFCGLACGCCVPIKLTDVSKYDEAVIEAKKKVIAQHDKRMRTDKRNRIRAGSARANSIGTANIRAAARRAIWPAATRSTPSDIWFTR